MMYSIVVPCYNEENNIEPLISKFEDIASQGDFELVMVNNGSNDRTLDIITENVATKPFITLVDIPINEGYGNGILRGLEAARGELIGWTHADLQTDPLDVQKGFELLVSSQNQRKTYVKGYRKNRPFFDVVFTHGMSIFESILLRRKLFDINAQPNLFHRDFFLKIKDNAPNDFSLDLYFYYKALCQGMNVERFDVLFPDRIHGESSWNDGLLSKYKFIKRTIKFSLELKRNMS